MMETENLKLVVFPSDSLKTYYSKGEIKERYYNPNNYFDEVHFISLNDEEIEEAKVQKLVGKAKIKIHTIGKWKPWPHPRMNKIILQRKVLHLVREINPAAVRAYDPLLPGYLAVYCGKKLNIPSIISLHADFDEEREYNRQFGWWRYLKFKLYSQMFEGYTLTNADKVMCVTKFLTNYAERYGASPEKIDVIYNRVDTKRFRSGGGDRDKMYIHLPLRIICVSRLNKQKNQQCLIQAIKDLPVELLLIGDGDQYEYLEFLTEKLGVQEKVKFIKSVPHSEIHKYYAESDIFALASDHEGMGIGTVEAMSSSLPVVVTNKEPLPEVVGDAGILVERTPEAFTEAFKELIDSPELRQELGAKGRARAMDFDAKLIEKKEAKMYDAAIKKVSNQITTLLGDTKYLHEERMNYLTNKIKEIKDIKKEKGDNTPLIVLDVGCGDGVVTKHILDTLTDTRDTLIGVDSDSLRLKRLSNRLNILVVVGDAANLPMNMDYADIIVLHHVLEHIVDDDKVILELKRVLKPGGWLIIGVPNEGGVVGTLLRMVHWRMYRVDENTKKGWHVHFYSRKSIRKKIEDNGLKVIEMKGIGAIFPFYPIHYFILKRRKLFKLGNWLTQKLKFTADSLFVVIEK